MAIKAKKIRSSRPEWNKAKQEIKKKGKQADRSKCKLDRGLTLFVGLH